MSDTMTRRRPPRRQRGASGRYLNLAVSDSVLGAAGGARLEVAAPGELLAAVEQLAGGRDAIVWIHDTAARAWQLPARLGDNHAETVGNLLGASVRSIGSTGWLVADGAHAVHLAFPEYSGDFAGLATAGELLQAVEAFRHAVGFGYVISSAKTVHTLISTWQTVGETSIEPELDGYTATAWATPANWWGLAELDVLEAAGCRCVRAFDRVGSYLSAWQGVTLPAGDWLTLPAGDLEPGPESSRPAGYWLIDPRHLPDVEGSFDPWRRHGDNPGPRWITTPLAHLAADLADDGPPVPYLAAVVGSERVRALDTAAARLRDARTALAAAPGAPPAAALTVLKGAYAGATAWFEYGPRPPEPLARPSWRRTIIDRYAANTWRALRDVTPAPFAFGEIDTALFALHDVDELPAGLKIGDGLGQWKPKGDPIAIGEARAALAAGGHRALL